MPLSYYVNRFTRLPLLSEMDGAGAGGGESHSDDANDDAGRDDALKDEGKRALDAERTARKVAEKAARETARELETLRAAQAKADEDKAAEEGRWKEIAEKREASLTETATTLANATTELDTLRTYVTAQLDQATKALPDVIRAFALEDDAPIGDRLAWLTKAQAQAAKLTDAATRGNGQNPSPSGGARAEAASPIPRSRMM